MGMKSVESDSIGPEWLGLRQITRYASISERTIRSWIHAPVDPLRAVRIGGKILVRRSELDAWLAQHQLHPLAAVDVDGIVKSILQGENRGR